ncbi:MAG: hypothetical protein WCF77_05015 [Minisyncoccia bacterium]
MKKIFFHNITLGLIAATAFFGCHLVLVAHADGLVVSPSVIDGNGVPNDILNYSLTITNQTGRQENIFAVVCELTPSGTVIFANPSVSDGPILLADWMSVSRAAIMLLPGESTTTPLTVQINPHAAAGNYHATVAFVTGDTRFDATQSLVGAPQALINISVASDLVASLRVDGFAAEKGFYTAFPVTFNYIIENNGDITTAPSGEVMFYDRLGHEVGSVDANPNSESVAPGEKKSFSAKWQNGGNLGEYKAILDLSYGDMNDRLENTALVWVLPWKKLIAVFGGLFVLTIVLALLLHRRYEKRHRLRRRAIENLLKKRKEETPQNNFQKGEHVLDMRHHHE